MPWWARVIVGVALVRIAVPLTLYFSGAAVRTHPAPLPLWAYAWLGSTFAVVGLMLVVANRRDARAYWLGGVFVLISVPLVWPVAGGSHDPQLAWMAKLRVEAFLPLFLWRFVEVFPGPATGRDATLARAMTAISAIVSLLAAVSNASQLLPLRLAPIDDWRVALDAERVRNSFYWPAVLLLGAAAFAFLVTRVREAEPPDRNRIRIFASGLVAGSLPLIVEIVLEQLFPSYQALAHRPRVEPWIGLIAFGALSIVPFVTAYSVLFDRIVDVRVVLHAAVQYALARYSILGITSIPFAALAMYIVRHREEPLAQLLTGARPLVLGSAALGGTLALRLRHPWLVALDKRFFREEYDARILLARLMTEQRHAASAEDLAFRVRTEIERALHAEAMLFVVNQRGDVYGDPVGRYRPIAASATLMGLLFADARPLDVDLQLARTPLARLREDERQWLSAAGFRLMIPMRAASGTPSGFLALGAKRSGLPYSEDDRHLLAAVAAAIGLELDNLKLRSTPSREPDPPARECADCRRLNPPNASACVCGGKLVPASVPYTLRGVFRFDRRIGSGGMGVVYRASDLTLGRDVAIKTLPRLGPEHAARLHKEARAMAALSHPNLAVVYSVEEWEGVPFLVEEFLGGGMLSTRLALGPINVKDALDLGIALTDALAALHAAHIIHCDIKPSNIGFTTKNVPKLLDFGLARLLRNVSGVNDTTTRLGGEEMHAAPRAVSELAVAGTPLYMAPEAFRGEPPRPSFDVWGLCVVLYEAITGHRPFYGVDADHVEASIAAGAIDHIDAVRERSPAVARFFSGALSWDASARPNDASSLEIELKQLRATWG